MFHVAPQVYSHSPHGGPESHPKASHDSIRRENGSFRQKGTNPTIGISLRSILVLCTGTSAFQKYQEKVDLEKSTSLAIISQEGVRRPTTEATSLLPTSHHPSNPPLFFQGVQPLNRLLKGKSRKLVLLPLMLMVRTLGSMRQPFPPHPYR